MAQNSQDLELTKVTVESKLLDAHQKKDENASTKTDSNQTASRKSSTSSSTSSDSAQSITIAISDAEMCLLREACKQFGFSDSLPPSTVYYRYLESLMRAKQIDELREVLNVMRDNVKCVARDLLSYATYVVDDDGEILRDVLKRDLPQHVVHSVFAELLQLSDWKLKQARIFCETRPELTRLYIHKNSSFPLLLLVNEFTNRVSKVKANENNLQKECIRRMALLLTHGAEINARALDEATPIHLAAKREAWEVVKMLLAYHANIDIEIEGETAREIISREKPELVENYKVQSENKTVKDKLYDALYKENEEEFLKLLIEHENFDVNTHNGKETFLQLAIVKKLEKSVEKLLERGADINLVAGLGIEPIILAFKNPDFECLKQLSDYRFLIKCNISHNSGTILHALETITLENVEKRRGLIESIIDEALYQNVNLYAVDNIGLNALQRIENHSSNGHILICMLLHFMVPKFDKSILQITPPQVFEKFFNEKIRYYGSKQSNSGTIRIHYNFMRPEKIKHDEIIPEMDLFYEMSKIPEYSKTVLQHPLVKLFLIYKWRRFAFVFIFNFFLYALFTLSLSMHVFKFVAPRNLTEIYEGNSTESDFHDHRPFDDWHIVGITFWTFIFLREVFQFAISCRSYIKNWENLLEIVLLIFSILTYLPNSEDSNLIRALAIILAYTELTLLIGRYPSNIGIYITMFTRVTMKSSKVVLIFAAFIFSFAFSFFIMFREIEVNKSIDASLWDSIVRTSGMAIGEINLGDIKKLSTFGGEIILLLFLLLVTIVFMNLLNALAISDTQSIINETQALCCVANIKHYTRIEAIFLRYDPDRMNMQDYLKKITERNRIIKFVHSLFPVNVFPLNSSQISESTVLEIKVNKNHFSPILYHPPLHLPYWAQRIHSWLQFCYFRVILHCNEDTILRQILAKKKYPDLNKNEPFNAEILQKGIQHHQDNLQNLKSQSEKWQQKLSEQIKEKFTNNADVQNKIMENQEHVSVNLTIAMQQQISELKKEMEQIKMEQILQIKEVQRDLTSLKAEMSNISEQLKEIVSCQQLREILSTELANVLSRTNLLPTVEQNQT